MEHTHTQIQNTNWKINKLGTQTGGNYKFKTFLYIIFLGIIIKNIKLLLFLFLLRAMILQSEMTSSSGNKHIVWKSREVSVLSDFSLWEERYGSSLPINLSALPSARQKQEGKKTFFSFFCSAKVSQSSLQSFKQINPLPLGFCYHLSEL